MCLQADPLSGQRADGLRAGPDTVLPRADPLCVRRGRLSSAADDDACWGADDVSDRAHGVLSDTHDLPGRCQSDGMPRNPAYLLSDFTDRVHYGDRHLLLGDPDRVSA